MKRIGLLTVFVMVLTVGITFGQTRDGLPKVYITPMENNFHTFLAAAIVERKVPVVLVSTDEAADYIIVGASVKGDNKWSDTIFGNEKDRNQGSITLVKKSDKTIAWAGSAGDKSFWVPGWISSGQKKVAQRIVDKMKKDYFKKI